MDITQKNFYERFDEFKKVIETASFFSIDGEFTGLSYENRITPFDIPSEYYKKTKENINGYILIQFGITAFRVSEDDPTKFKYRSYNFYIYPRLHQKRFECQGDSMAFLANNNFNFNKLFRDGISYCDMIEARSIRAKFEETYKSGPANEYEEVAVPENEEENLKNILEIIEEFLVSTDEEKIIDNCNPFQRRLIYQLIETKFATKLSASPRVLTNNKKVIVLERKKSADAEKELFEEKMKKRRQEMEDFIGFSNFIDLLSKSKKLIIGHNMLLDVIYIIKQFVAPLPNGLQEFKQITHKAFPNFLDTKFLCTDDRFKKEISSSVLASLYETVSKEPFTMPIAEADSDEYSYSLENKREHEAGYDSYLTGMCFLAMTHFMNIEPKDVNEKNTHLRNVLNKLFAMKIFDINHINFTGKEPQPSRDHVFHVTIPDDWKQSNIIHHFRNFGNIFVAWISAKEAYVSLYNREHSPILIKSIGKLDGFKIVSFADYQLSKNNKTDNIQPQLQSNKRKLVELECSGSASTVASESKKKLKTKKRGKKTSSAGFAEDDTWT